MNPQLIISRILQHLDTRCALHRRYKQFLTTDEANRLVAPKQSDIAEVTTFASSTESVAVDELQGTISCTFFVVTVR